MIIEDTNIEEIIKDYVELKPKGASLFGLSPFTDEKTPSFCVDIKNNCYKDFSSGKSGNVVNFLMELENVSFQDAIEILAKKQGKEVVYISKESSAELESKRSEKSRLMKLLIKAHKNYQKLYFNLENDHSAKVEIEKKRQYTQECIIEWGIGFARGGQQLYKLFHEKEFTDAENLGLINLEKKCDKFWNRVIYPIHDQKGILIGFSGRDISNTEKAAKWINPKTNLLYDKSKVWYGLHRALRSIRSKDQVWITEGYNDVISWHLNGVINTISPCGTEISDFQINILKRYCSKVVLCFDSDKAGTNATVKAAKSFIAQGFKVDTIVLPGCDPDEFVRQFKEDFKELGLESFVVEKFSKDGFKFLLNELVSGDATEISMGARELCGIISDIEDEGLQEIYLGWIKKESNIKIGILRDWIKDKKNEAERSNQNLEDNKQFELPSEVTTSFEELSSDILKYGLFIDNNKIWVIANAKESEKKHFKPISNFAIKIIQHMQDEKFPMKLIKIENIHGDCFVFDTLSDNLNSKQKFDNIMTGCGNFLFSGSPSEFDKLRAFLFDKMGNGRKVETLGWQPEGFWVWNNKVNTAKEIIPIDENGIFNHNGVSYYVPSANIIFKNNPYKFEAQKRIISSESEITFADYTRKMREVHKDFSITAILFTLASIFQDYISHKNENFPLMFIYGPGSTGKDQLIKCCMSFFGKPQTAINLEGGLSTDKAKIREFAQFSNLISHLSEYKSGDAKLDGILKGLHDRRGYKRGTIDSHVSTESIPILCSVAMTGNDYPDNPPLITRLLCMEMDQNQFTVDENRNYDSLNEMSELGVSHITDRILTYREYYIDNFKKVFQEQKDYLSNILSGAVGRMISDNAVLTTTFHLLKNHLEFPFTQQEMEEHLKSCVKKQIAKINSASKITKWWDCFIASLRGANNDRIIVGIDVKLNNNFLSFNFTQCFNKIQRQWYQQYKELSPSNNEMMKIIQADSCYVENVKSMRMGSGANSKNTSAYTVNLDKINIGVDLKEEINRLSSHEFIPS